MFSFFQSKKEKDKDNEEKESLLPNEYSSVAKETDASIANRLIQAIKDTEQKRKAKLNDLVLNSTIDDEQLKNIQAALLADVTYNTIKIAINDTMIINRLFDRLEKPKDYYLDRLAQYQKNHDHINKSEEFYSFLAEAIKKTAHADLVKIFGEKLAHSMVNECMQRIVSSVPTTKPSF